jgi:hypothetical protein
VSRWDIHDAAQQRQTEPDAARPGPPSDPDSRIPAGRSGASDETPVTPPYRSERQRVSADARTPERRLTYQDRGRSYALRGSEMAAMSDIGRFRTIDTADLGRYVYGGDSARLTRDLASLRQQGLIEEKTVFRAHRQARRVVTLTDVAHRILRKAGGLPLEQKLYHGFVKARETNHDADLYRVYQLATAKVQAAGGRPLRVRLDFELKALVQREKQAVKRLPEGEQRARLAMLAERHGLTLSGTSLHVPDVQLEYETRDQVLARENLELISENYRSQGIQSKAASGFTLYARGNDAARVRRALPDSRSVARILSI